ncbi:protein kinase C delta type-like [Pyxicephalus adspersus]|uniref:protein kinase C delta type-like n=1 Tax=Pyxicephalus adspersus TaxID=30357 RepID=UPI003B5B6F62
MEYLRGGDLNKLIKSFAPLPISTIRFLAAQIYCGLQHLHKLGIIHRDIKPENILLDKEGHVKIADFGLSRLNVLGSKMANSYAGTEDFLAPEIELEQPYDGTADYYSLGVVMFQMATGKDAHLVEQRDSHYPRHMDPHLRDVIEKLLLKDQNKRRMAVKKLKGHMFFRPINWTELEAGKATPPFAMPQCPETDRSQTISVQKLISKKTKKMKKIPKLKQKLFDGFSFTSNKWQVMQHTP